MRRAPTLLLALCAPLLGALQVETVSISDPSPHRQGPSSSQGRSAERPRGCRQPGSEPGRQAAISQSAASHQPASKAGASQQPDSSENACWVACSVRGQNECLVEKHGLALKSDREQHARNHDRVAEHVEFASEFLKLG